MKDDISRGWELIQELQKNWSTVIQLDEAQKD